MTLKLRTTDLSWRQIDDEVVVLDAERASYLAINGSGARLWSALAAGASVDELADILVEAYAIDRTRAIADAREFISNLTEQGLIAA